MNIGTTIKKLRREKEMTQETLAEYLGVSVSAVSQWESERTMPDLALIPSICNLLGVSADDLLGIHLAQKQQKISAITDEADAYSSRGYDTEAYRILKAGLKTYPDSYEIMWGLMYVTFQLGYSKDHTEEEREAFTDEAIRLGETILEKCLDDSTRHSAIQVLCMIYPRRGNRERAKELAKKMPTMVCSREFLMTHVYDSGNEGDRTRKRCAYDLLQFLARDMVSHPMVLDNGEKAYSAEEMAMLRDKQIALFDLMFEDGDYGFYHGVLSATHESQARYYAKRGEAECALAHLGLAADHAIGFVRLLEGDEGDGRCDHTSLLFRGLSMGKGGISVSYTDNDAQQLLNHMKKPEFDFVRETEVFAAITEKLSAYAGKWKPAE